MTFAAGAGSEVRAGAELGACEPSPSPTSACTPFGGRSPYCTLPCASSHLYTTAPAMPDQAIRAANNRRRFIVRSSLESYMLQRVRPGLTGANSHRLPQLRNEYLTVANLTRTRRFYDGF